MIKEAYVSYEIAKLLKEKGFDEECTHYYSYEDDELIEYTNGVYSRNSKDCHRCTSPTHQMACAWLREKFLYHIEVRVFGIDKGRERTDEWKYFFEIIFPRTFTQECNSLCYKNDGYSTYEEAVEAALKYSLENFI